MATVIAVGLVAGTITLVNGSTTVDPAAAAAAGVAIATADRAQAAQRADRSGRTAPTGSPSLGAGTGQPTTTALVSAAPPGACSIG